jgi:transcription termination factor NusB
VEIAKNYGADGSPRFVNGALGHAIRILKIKYGE